MIPGTQLCQLCVYIYIHIYIYIYTHIYLCVCLYIISYFTILVAADPTCYEIGRWPPACQFRACPSTETPSTTSKPAWPIIGFTGQGLGKCPNETSPNYWGYDLQQICEGPKKGYLPLFTNPLLDAGSPSTSPAWVPLGPSLAKSRPRSAWIQAAPILKTGCCKF